jgi:hypothetical protein
MIQGLHTVEREMPRSWQHLPKYLTAHLLDRYSIDIRLLFDLKSNNNRRTIEQLTKNRAVNPVSTPCQVPVNNEPTVWLQRTNIEPTSKQ